MPLLTIDSINRWIADQGRGSLSALAREIGVPPSNLKLALTGHRPLSLDRANAIFDAMCRLSSASAAKSYICGNKKSA